MQRKSWIAGVWLLAVLTILPGCASLPSPEAMKAETAMFQLPKLPESGKAMVYVVRPSGVGGLVRFNVFVDDQEATSEMGFTRGSQYIYFSVAPGQHRIYSKAENWADINVDAKAGYLVHSTGRIHGLRHGEEQSAAVGRPAWQIQRQTVECRNAFEARQITAS